jgi:methylase of polypeptide subunit release factors
MTNSISDLLRGASQVLRDAGVPEARREAGSLLSHVIARDRTFLISHAEDRVRDEEMVAFRKQLCEGRMASRFNTSLECSIFTGASFA